MQLPDGREIERDIVERPESVLVLPIGQKNNVMLIEEYDLAADTWQLTLPGGRVIDPTPEGIWQQAQAELREETGFRAGKLEKLLDLGMIRKSARLYIQYAEALFVGRDLSCCFYAIEGLKIARSVGSKYNIWRVKELAAKLPTLFPHDMRVKELS